MNKKIMLGALALSATAVFGLTGCGDKKDNDQTPETIKYTVTFDADSSRTDDDVVREFEKGATALDPSQIPALPDVEGFAGQWESFTLNDQNITVNAVYGNGSQSNPYMIATDAQFGRMLDVFAATRTTILIDSNSAETTDEDLAVTKIVQYKTAKVTYTKNAQGGWDRSAIEVTEKTYFKLINDIVLDNISNINQLQLADSYFAGEIDGQGHSISGLDGTRLVANSGALFGSVVDTTFKDLTVNMGANLGSLAYIARGGDVLFENVTIKNTNARPTYMTADDTNESPFIFHALGSDTTLTFRNCVNEANIVSSADYCGIFLGGYAGGIERLSFENCVNKGNVKSSGSVGMLIGNGYQNPQAINIENCKNEGVIETAKDSHILVSYKTGSGLVYNNVAAYDVADNGYNSTLFTDLTSQHKANIVGNDIQIAKADGEGEHIAAGLYRLMLSAYARNASGATLLTTIVIDQSVDADTESTVFEMVNYAIMDLETYNATTLANDKINSTTLQPNEWTYLEGYNVKYFVDKTNGVYVIDYSGLGEADNGYKINQTAESLMKAVVVYGVDGGNNQTIDFVVDFN